MKKLILTAAALLVTLSVHAQGTINFQNNAATAIINSFTGNPVASTDGLGMLVALYWAPIGSDTFVQLGGNVNMPSPSSQSGRFLGGTRTTGIETPPGELAQFIVKAWESAYGTSYEAAVAAAPQNGRVTLRGESDVIVARTGTILTTPGSLVASGPGLTPMESFTVVVPEPSTIALGVIGMGALLLLRRRK